MQEAGTETGHLDLTPPSRSVFPGETGFFGYGLEGPVLMRIRRHGGDSPVRRTWLAGNVLFSPVERVSKSKTGASAQAANE
jgi:hypothetical protein